MTVKRKRQFLMKHDWEPKNPAPNTPYFKYFGCVDLRECRNCKKVQAKHADHLWGRVTGYYWTPKVGRCPGKSDQK